MRRSLLLVTFLFPTVLAGQTANSPPPPPNGVIYEFGRYADLYGSRLVAAFDSIPATHYGYHPTPSQQSVGYIAQHLENANYGLCERLGDAKRPRTSKDSSPDSVKARWPKDTLVARLVTSLRFCDAAIDRLGDLTSPAIAANLILFETDLAEHYSQISAYMRLLGLVPPSALPAKHRTPIALPASELAQYVGTYDLARGVQIVIAAREGALYIRSVPGGAEVRLWPESATSFFVTEVDAQVTFTRTADGAISGLVVHQSGRDRSANKRR